MGLTWLLVVMAGCVALAACIAAVLLQPMDAERRRLRPLANAQRLTRLPAYVRAARARTRTAAVTIALLVVMFAASMVVAARPTGLPTAARDSAGVEPEEIILCSGAPAADPAVNAALRYFADHVGGFGTERIGLTSQNRRVVPLTRDHQYAKKAFSDYARTAEPSDVASFSPTVSYLDYAESVEDLLALCLTGFPAVDQDAEQRRSLIYVGPGALHTPDDQHPALFTSDRVRDLAIASGVQINAIVANSDSSALVSLARDTGGMSFPADSDVTAHLAEIRDNPPKARFSEQSDAFRLTESPDMALLLALLATAVLAAWPLVQRR